METTENMNARQINLTPQTLVSDVLQRFPQTVAVFLENRTGCVGCDLAGFCSLKDVAEAYKLDIDQLLGQLQQTAAQ